GARRDADGACDFNATPKERRPGRGIRRSGNGKHYQAAKHNRIGKVNGIIRWLFFAVKFALSILYANKSTTSDSALRRELMKSQGATQASPSATPAQFSPSPVSSPAPDSGAGVLPAGSASPATSASPIAQATASPTA